MKEKVRTNQTNKQHNTIDSHVEMLKGVCNII